MERDTEAAAHTDSLVPVARVSRRSLGRDAGLLRKYVAGLGGPAPRGPEGVTREHILAANLIAIAAELESWAECDWTAAIGIGPGREHPDGPLPPFPGPAAE
jgi:hypothetical protein